MKAKIRKILALVLTALVIVSVFAAVPFTASAAEADKKENIGSITNLNYDNVYVAGNWFKDAVWVPDDDRNLMKEVAKDVWEISFENVPQGFECKLKFTIDGKWTHNFGGSYAENGVETAAVYDGDAITFDTDYTCTVKVHLDLRCFDYVTKRGATFTITIKDGYNNYDNVYVAGNWFKGAVWAPDDDRNLMKEVAKDVWEISFENVPQGFECQLKFTIDGKWTHNFGGSYAESGVETAAVYDGSNIIFDTCGICTVTARLDLRNFSISTKEGATFTITLDYSKPKHSFPYKNVYAVGNGEGFWLNGAVWSSDTEKNLMTEVANDVWEISFDNVPEGFECHLKFTIDGKWTHNFGGSYAENGVETAAVYDGDTITFDTDYTCTVKVHLDLRCFDYVTKRGATFTITIKDGNNTILEKNIVEQVKKYTSEGFTENSPYTYIMNSQASEDIKLKMLNEYFANNGFTDAKEGIGYLRDTSTYRDDYRFLTTDEIFCANNYYDWLYSPSGTVSRGLLYTGGWIFNGELSAYLDITTYTDKDFPNVKKNKKFLKDFLDQDSQEAVVFKEAKTVGRYMEKLIKLNNIEYKDSVKELHEKIYHAISLSDIEKYQNQLAALVSQKVTANNSEKIYLDGDRFSEALGYSVSVVEFLGATTDNIIQMVNLDKEIAKYEYYKEFLLGIYHC